MLRANGLRRVQGLADAIGISERQLRRRFHAAVGYGPKTLARVLRFQRMLRLAAGRGGEPERLARLALEAGYADQAHMTAECTRLAGQPPARLLASRGRSAA
jgi:AraC-like DNA-binding protein